MKNDKFDNLMKEKARLETFTTPENFNERNDVLLNNLINNTNTPKNFINFSKFRYQSAAAIIIILIMLGGISVAAQRLTGGGFFTQFFNNLVSDDANTDYGFMNTEQLNEMDSNIVGTVIDTNELKIDILGIVVSGNTAKLMVEITANELDSVLYDNGFETLKNYRFNGETLESSANIDEISTRYYFSDEDTALAPNQFKILFTIISKKPFHDEIYSMEFDKFGYFTNSIDKSGTNFVTIYDSNWEFDFTLNTDSHTDSSKLIFINKPITIGNKDLIIDSIKITPLASTIKLKCKSGSGYSDEYYNNIFKDFSNGLDNITFQLDDDYNIDNKHFMISGSKYENIIEANIIFNVPISVDKVKSITLFDATYSTLTY